MNRPKWCIVQPKTAKFNASTGIEKIIEYAKYYKPNVNRKPKRKANADRGFDYYNVVMAYPNEDGTYTLYSGLLNVRKDKNGLEYAYDITNTRKRIR